MNQEKKKRILKNKKIVKLKLELKKYKEKFYDLIYGKERKYKIFVTGGHVTPAVACIEELKSRRYTNIIYIGQKKSLLFDKNPSAEFRLITEKVDIPFKAITAGKLSLFGGWQSIIWILRVPIGFIQAFWFQITQRPRMILTFGSHVAVPVVIVGWLFRTPIIVHEQTVTLGRANKLIQRFATKVCYSWQKIPQNQKEASSKEFKKFLTGSKFIYTGNPIRKEMLKSKSKKFNFTNKKKKIILVTGGNQGAHAINEFIFNNIEYLTKEYNIIHQTGSNSIFKDYEKAMQIAEKLNSNAISYIPMNYLLTEEMSEAMHKASVLISRGGANTATEMLVLKKKAVLIPISTSSGNEQFLNSKMLEDIGLAKVINQAELSTINILEIIKSLEELKLIDPDMIKIMGTVHKTAPKRIIDIFEAKLRNLES